MLALAWKAKALLANQDAAVLFELDPRGPKVKAVGRRGAHADESPIVTLLQGRDPGGPPGARPLAIAATYDPTEMCTGMAWKYPVRYIVHLRANAMRKITITDDGASFAGAAVAPGGAQIPLAASEAGMPAFAWDDFAWVNPWFQWLTDVAGKTTAGTRALTLAGMAAAAHTARAAAPAFLDNSLPAAAPVATGAGESFRDNLFMHLVFGLIRGTWATEAAGRAAGLVPGYNIAAVLVNAEGRIIAWGINCVSTNKSFHAETVMIQSYLRRAHAATLPAGTTMYTSLESCHMCAGYAATVGAGLRVVFGQADGHVPNNALKRKVAGTVQLQTTATFHAGAAPPVRLEPSGDAVAALDALFAQYKAVTRRTGAVGFLYDALSQYFFARERSQPAHLLTMLHDIAQAPDPARLRTPSPAPVRRYAADDLIRRNKERVRSNMGITASLNLDGVAGRRSAPITPTQRLETNVALFGRELALTAHVLGFIQTLKTNRVWID